MQLIARNCFKLQDKHANIICYKLINGIVVWPRIWQGLPNRAKIVFRYQFGSVSYKRFLVLWTLCVQNILGVIQIQKSTDRARNGKCYCFNLNDGITVKHRINSQCDAVCWFLFFPIDCKHKAIKLFFYLWYTDLYMQCRIKYIFDRPALYNLIRLIHCAEAKCLSKYLN